MLSSVSVCHVCVCKWNERVWSSSMSHCSVDCRPYHCSRSALCCLLHLHWRSRQVFVIVIAIVILPSSEQVIVILIVIAIMSSSMQFATCLLCLECNHFAKYHFPIAIHYNFYGQNEYYSILLFCNLSKSYFHLDNIENNTCRTHSVDICIFYF